MCAFRFRSVLYVGMCVCVCVDDNHIMCIDDNGQSDFDHINHADGIAIAVLYAVTHSNVIKTKVNHNAFNTETMQTFRCAVHTSFEMMQFR